MSHKSFIPSWCVCRVISINVWTAFWMGVHLISAGWLPQHNFLDIHHKWLHVINSLFPFNGWVVIPQSGCTSICLTIYLLKDIRWFYVVVQLLSHIQLFTTARTLWPQGPQHTRLLCRALSPGVCWDSCPLSWWCHPTILSSAASFSSFCLHSFPATASFPISSLFTLGGQTYVGFYSS